MALIQGSITGTSLSWYIHLNDTYKQDLSAFVQPFKKQFSSQKNAYYAQVESLTLVKKDNGLVRHFALEVQKLAEKAGAMRMLLSSISTVRKFSQKVLQKA